MLLGCNSQTAPRQPLDGVWRLAAAHYPIDPRSLTLTQHDSTVTGTGSAMGVDAPMSVTVTGTASLPVVVLTFDYGSGRGRYTATLKSDAVLLGRVEYDPTFVAPPDSLTFVKQ